MKQLRTLIEKVAQTDANILITGENGTGKEMLAREIHALSARYRRDMITVDMGAITESLFESELFGHKKARLPMPHTDRAGKFEAAHEGTLFLDEIGKPALSPAIQTTHRHSKPKRGASRKQRTDTGQHTFDLRHQL